MSPAIFAAQRVLSGARLHKNKYGGNNLATETVGVAVVPSAG